MTTPMGRDALGEAKAELDARAEAMGVRYGTLRSVRHREWIVSVTGPERTVRLRAKGNLAAIVAGAMDDYEAAA